MQNPQDAASTLSNTPQANQAQVQVLEQELEVARCEIQDAQDWAMMLK